MTVRYHLQCNEEGVFPALVTWWVSRGEKKLPVKTWPKPPWSPSPTTLAQLHACVLQQRYNSLTKCVHLYFAYTFSPILSSLIYHWHCHVIVCKGLELFSLTVCYVSENRTSSVCGELSASKHHIHETPCICHGLLVIWCLESAFLGTWGRGSVCVWKCLCIHLCTGLYIVLPAIPWPPLETHSNVDM